MKKIKTKIKGLIKPINQGILLLQFTVIIITISILTIGTVQFVKTSKNVVVAEYDNVMKDFDYSTATLIIPKAKAEEEEFTYKYNDKISIEIVKAEIIKQAKIYGNDEQFMLDLAFCESGYNNLAKNPTSTALGIYQWLIKSWEETESFKKHKIARTDYKANIKEAMLAIERGENWRWVECLNK